MFLSLISRQERFLLHCISKHECKHFDFFVLADSDDNERDSLCASTRVEVQKWLLIAKLEPVHNARMK